MGGRRPRRAPDASPVVHDDDPLLALPVGPVLVRQVGLVCGVHVELHAASDRDGLRRALVELERRALDAPADDPVAAVCLAVDDLLDRMTDLGMTPAAAAVGATLSADAAASRFVLGQPLGDTVALVIAHGSVRVATATVHDDDPQAAHPAAWGVSGTSAAVCLARARAAAGGRLGDGPALLEQGWALDDHGAITAWL